MKVNSVLGSVHFTFTNGTAKSLADLAAAGGIDITNALGFRFQAETHNVRLGLGYTPTATVGELITAGDPAQQIEKSAPPIADTAYGTTIKFVEVSTNALLHLTFLGG